MRRSFLSVSQKESLVTFFFCFFVSTGIRAEDRKGTSGFGTSAYQATPQSKAKPAGVHGCEVWVKFGGDAPKDASELGYLGVSTTSAYTATYEGKQANIMAYYWLRWVNTRGEHGPWSTTVSSIIVG
jgi:hypothetical protein